MYKNLKSNLFLFPLALMTFLLSCSTLPGQPAADRLVAYSVGSDETLLSRYAPVFVIENYNARYNRVGTPSAEMASGMKEKIYVDPEKATVYSQKRVFETFKGIYTNLVYRVHFEEIPGGLVPFHIGKGKNTGLIVIVTLSSRNEPILYTTVHTCGCYLAFVPTSYMPVSGFPAGWERKRQSVFSENLPGFLDYKGLPPDRNRVVILLRDGSHRVKDIGLSTTDALKKYTVVGATIQPLDALEELVLKNDATTSFFETSGPRKGYVKESQKIRERFLMSWWAFDWRVGEDKKFGQDKNNGVRFYTSLKPWGREKSDMRDFVTFLNYWKWNL